MRYGYLRQPIASSDGSIRGYEILAREMVEDELASSSESLLKWAWEDCQRIREIDCKALDWAISLTPDGFPYHVNLGAETVGDWAYFSKLGSALKAGVASLIIFEISEEIDPGDENARIWIEMIRAMGFSVYLDDFGYFHSNNRSLKSFRPNGLKLDGEIVRGVADLYTLGILEKELLFCQKHGLACVAEHVENPLILKALSELCDRIDFKGLLYQGWHFGKGDLIHAGSL
jgi:EAL domain-containing protein (putative c-di-GMP-specific phosphodiesterase class I)